MFSLWVREALKRDFVVVTNQEHIVCTTGAAAIHIFIVGVSIYFYVFVLILLSPAAMVTYCFSTQISVPVSSSADICT